MTFTFRKMHKFDLHNLAITLYLLFSIVLPFVPKYMLNWHVFYRKNSKQSPPEGIFGGFAWNTKAIINLQLLMRVSVKNRTEITKNEGIMTHCSIVPRLVLFCNCYIAMLIRFMSTHVRASEKIWRWGARHMRFFAKCQKYREFWEYVKKYRKKGI